VLNFDGMLHQFDGATGALGWSRQMPVQWAFSSAPTYSNGVIYLAGAGDAGTVYAVDAATGTVNWTASVMNGDDSSPAVSDRGVYVSYACNNTYAFDPITGANLWTHFGTCEGGGGRTPVISSAIGLLARDFVNGNLVFGLHSGKVLGSFRADPAPAVVGAVSYSVFLGQLTAHDHTAGRNLWTFPTARPLTTAPIVVDGVVFVGDLGGNLFGVNAASGVQVWHAKLSTGIPRPDEHIVTQPLTGLGAGDGLVVVPAGNVVTAYGR
jgi:outer membrane protein assembly factor BamB